MNKYRRNCMIMAVVLFTIAAILIGLAIDEAMADDSSCLKLHKSTPTGDYLKMECDGSAHVYFAIYDVAFNYGSVISSENTHTAKYVVDMRPKRADDEGNLTPEFLRWMSKLKYRHLTKKGEKLYLLSRSGMDKTTRTEKSGKYYVYFWKNDAAHTKYVKWCLENNINPNH